MRRHFDSTDASRFSACLLLQGKKGPKIRQGSPEEEAALESYIASLAPSGRQCSEVGQLAELLVLLGHERDARKLQAELSGLLTKQKAAAEYARLEGPAAVREANNVGQAAVPLEPAVDWKWDILRPV